MAFGVAVLLAADGAVLAHWCALALAWIRNSPVRRPPWGELDAIARVFGLCWVITHVAMRLSHGGWLAPHGAETTVLVVCAVLAYGSWIVAAWGSFIPSLQRYAATASTVAVTAGAAFLGASATIW